MKKEKIRIGFVGAGRMGQLAHLANYVPLEDCEVAALAEGRPDLAQKVARRYSVPQVFPDHRSMLDGTELDAVVAIMHYSLNYATVPDLLNAGKHVLTEKPHSMRASSGRELADLAEKKDLVYQVGYMKRHDLGSRYARDTVLKWKQSGEAGRLKHARCTIPGGDWVFGIEPFLQTDEPFPEYPGQEQESSPEWMNESEARKHNGYINFYIHQINLLRYLLDEEYELDYVDPFGHLWVALSESGATVVLEMQPHSASQEWKETFDICFEHGCVSLSLPAPLARQHTGQVEVYRNFGPGAPAVERPRLAPSWGFGEQARAFVDCVRNGTPCIAPASDAVRDLEIAEDYIRLSGDGKGM